MGLMDGFFDCLLILVDLDFVALRFCIVVFELVLIVVCAMCWNWLRLLWWNCVCCCEILLG